MALRLHALALAACTAGNPAFAQDAEPAPAAGTTVQSLERVTITGRVREGADVTGFSQPLARTPMQALALTDRDLREIGAQRLADLVSRDAAVSDSYNAAGYWDFLSVRGFTLDNRFNFRRDGLPINAETSIALANKAGVELLKGASGIQAGTSAPGGLVNYLVKRPLPTATPLRSVGLELRSQSSAGAQADLAQRFGEGEAFGVRVNLAAERLDPPTDHARGRRHLLAVAGDWRLSADTLIEAEVEVSHQRQPSVPGFSLLGSRVPEPADPRVNLNNQPWSLPVVFDGTTASLRWQHRLNADWKLLAHAGTQRLATDDRIAFPFGCSAEGNFDRYCSDGTFDLYDFRSDDERRRTDALDLSLRGRAEWAGMAHELTAGVLLSRFRTGFARQAFNFAGTGNVQGTLVTPPAPDATGENTNRRERTSELYVRDAVPLAAAWQAWLGLRATRLSRETVLTSGAEGNAYARTITTPWLALSHEFMPRQLVYASWGQGVESEIAPNQERYVNAREPLPPLKSRQFELGAKGSSEAVQWSVAAFDIRRPQSATVPAGVAPCTDAPASCRFARDGIANHRGVEGSLGLESGPWAVSASAMWLHARRDGSSDTGVNGQRPVNVPARTLKAHGTYRVAALLGLAVSAALVHEGDRQVLPNDAALRIAQWTRLDLGASLQHKAGDNAMLTWRAGVDNATNRRAWREAPLQFGHVYLFPLAGRTWRLSLQADL